MRTFCLLLVGALLVPNLGHADDTEDCVQQKDYQLKAAGCSRAIASGKWSGKRLAWAYNNRGNAHINLKNYDAALRDLNKALELDPAHVNAMYNRGITYSRLNRMRDSEAQYSKVIRLKQDYWQAYQNRAYVREKLGDLSRALSDVNEVFRYKPGHLRSLQARANILCKRGDVESSLQDRREVIRRGFWKAGSARKWLTGKGYDTKGAEGPFKGAALDALRRWTKDGCPGI